MHGDCKNGLSSCWEPVPGPAHMTVRGCWDGDAVEKMLKQGHALVHTHNLHDLDMISKIVAVWQMESDTQAHERSALGRSLLVWGPWSLALDELIASTTVDRSHQDGRPPRIVVSYTLVSGIFKIAAKFAYNIVRGSFLILNFTP